VFWLLVLLQAASPEPEALRVRPGEITPGIKCLGAPEFSYELYVPKGFDPARAWPVLYVFDPRGRGRLGAELFQDGAEARGYLVVSSNDTESDNPKAPNTAVVNALWNDTHQRLPIDVRRRYAAGFSGGARMANSLGLGLKGGLAGVVSVGGGFAPNQPPVKDLPFAVFGAVGSTDFNYYEMRQLDVTLEKLGAAHRLEVFAGQHGWPSAPLAAVAIEWFDLAAMRKGVVPRDPALALAFAARETQRAADLEAAGKPAEADAVWEALGRDLQGIGDTSQIAARRAALAPGAGAERKRREKLDRRDAGINARNDGVIAGVSSAEDVPPLGRVLGDLDVAGLLEAGKRADYDGDSARRRLAHIGVQTSFYVPRELMGRGEWRRAMVLLQVAAAITPEAAFVHWGLTRCQARLGARKDALQSLERAVASGLSLPRARVASDADLASLRQDPGFAGLLARLPE